MSDIQFSETAKQLKPGVYEHYKGNQYEVVGVAHHSESLEELVVYKALYGSRGIWVRPLQMFVEELEIKGKHTPRFKFIKNT